MRVPRPCRHRISQQGEVNVPARLDRGDSGRAVVLDNNRAAALVVVEACLLYTSDAADE